MRDQTDMVRHELACALADEALILVPTLVEGAEIPSLMELPVVLRPLFEDWNVCRITEEGWEDNIRRLIDEISEATGLPVGPDVDALLRDAGAAQQRIAEFEQQRHLQADQIRALQRTVEELGTKLAEGSAEERPEITAAFAALARDDTLAAEEAFERELGVQRRAHEQTSRGMHKRRSMSPTSLCFAMSRRPCRSIARRWWRFPRIPRLLACWATR